MFGGLCFMVNGSMCCVVLRSPTDFRGAGLATLWQEIRVLGRVFGTEAEATRLVEELSETERLIAARVAGVSDTARVRALYLGLASGARASRWDGVRVGA
jgi:iron complex transport system substrate-binding protein